MVKPQPRENGSWQQKLAQPGPERAQALADLDQIIVRGLGYALATRADVTKADVARFARETVSKILSQLDAFPGESRFTTWALKLAVHTAFSELRRRRAPDRSLDAVTVPPAARQEIAGYLPNTLADPSAGTEQQAVQREVLGLMRDVIEEKLADRRRTALLAPRFQATPAAQVPHRLHAHPTALYKLLRDARPQLQSRLLASGLSRDDILTAFGL